MRWKFRRSDAFAGPRSAATMKALRPTCWTAYAQPMTSPAESSPPPPNAFGSAADMARLTSMRTTSRTRSSSRSGSIQFVTQVV
jgi:hypothetical protein